MVFTPGRLTSAFDAAGEERLTGQRGVQTRTFDTMLDQRLAKSGANVNMGPDRLPMPPAADRPVLGAG